jgi:hypothetical protein
LTFRRMADRRPVETLVERDDGVVFSMRGAGGGADLPHDLVHAVVEEQLSVADGIWGCVADGVVWRTMRHLSGRQPPHAAERSARLKRERAVPIRHAELTAAAAELTVARRRWAALAPGDEWVLSWDVSRPSAGRAGRRASPRATGGAPGRSPAAT